MKHIKAYEYEYYESSPQLGDWVLINNKLGPKIFQEFINNTPGRITKISGKDVLSSDEIDVRYYDATFELKRIFNHEGKFKFKPEQIVAFGVTKDELQIKIDAIKYNL